MAYQKEARVPGRRPVPVDRDGRPFAPEGKTFRQDGGILNEFAGWYGDPGRGHNQTDAARRTHPRLPKLPKEGTDR